MRESWCPTPTTNGSDVDNGISGFIDLLWCLTYEHRFRMCAIKIYFECCPARDIGPWWKLRYRKRGVRCASISCSGERHSRAEGVTCLAPVRRGLHRPHDTEAVEVGLLHG